MLPFTAKIERWTAEALGGGFGSASAPPLGGLGRGTPWDAHAPAGGLFCQAPPQPEEVEVSKAGGQIVRTFGGSRVQEAPPLCRVARPDLREQLSSFTFGPSGRLAFYDVLCHRRCVQIIREDHCPSVI